MSKAKNSLEIIKDTVQPTTFINAAVANSNHQISNSVLLVNEVINKIEDYSARSNGQHTTSEKNVARSISAAMKYYW